MKRFKNLKRLLYSTMLTSLIILGSVNVFAFETEEDPSLGESAGGGGSSDGKPVYIMVDENDARFIID